MSGQDRAHAEPVVITVVYDNNPGDEGLAAAWGFACVVQGLPKTILFDTGGDGPILLGNMRALHLDPKQIDVVVLSHIHGDHTGGLSSFLRARAPIPVFVPIGFPERFKKAMQVTGAECREAAESEVVCPGARTTGTMGRAGIEEQGLCVKTSRGWVLITGCAHPGVADMAAQAKEVTGGPIYLVVGGFHMVGQSEQRINSVMDRFEELGVRKVAPCHCSGDGARALFKKRFGEGCVLPGVGTVLRLEADE